MNDKRSLFRLGMVGLSLSVLAVASAITTIMANPVLALGLFVALWIPGTILTTRTLFKIGE